MALTFQTDPYRRSIETDVVAAEPGGTAGGGWRVVLADTVLYPEGGGQPADRGTVAEVPVLDVRREGERVVHVLAGPLPEGARTVRVAVDWARRFDHMQQHTTQHLLTAIAQDRHGWPTTAFHLGVERCDIDLDCDGLAEADLAALEGAVNAEIRAARSVRAFEVEPAAMAALGVRTRGLPEGHRGGVRLIEIEGIDRNTCGGTHVASTAELGALVLLGTERVHRQTRLHWLAGDRVRASFHAALGRERTLTDALAAPPAEHALAVGRLLDDQRAGRSERKALTEELTAVAARALAADARSVSAWQTSVADLRLLNAVANAALAERPDALVLLTGGGLEGGVFLLAGEERSVAALGPEVAALLEGRGGGAKGRYQGKAARLDRAAAALDRLRSSASNPASTTSTAMGDEPELPPAAQSDSSRA